MKNPLKLFSASIGGFDQIFDMLLGDPKLKIKKDLNGRTALHHGKYLDI